MVSRTIPPSVKTTGFALDVRRTTQRPGVARGITVRSRSIVGTLGAGLQTLVTEVFYCGTAVLATRAWEKTR